MPEPIAPIAFVQERPFWKDPVWLFAALLFAFNFVDAWQGGWTFPEVKTALVAAAVMTFQVVKPYVRSYVPFLDKNNPDVGLR